MEQFWFAVSFIGWVWVWIFTPVVLLVVYFVIRKVRPDSRCRKPLKAFLLILIPSMAVVLGTTHLTKLLFPVERLCTVCTGPDVPLGCNPYCETDGSFPSGHAAASLTAFTALYLALISGGRSRRTRILGILIFIIPVLVVASRMVLGVHTMPDVLAGALLGIGITSIVWSLEKKRFGF